jgi:hypothetical protein
MCDLTVFSADYLLERLACASKPITFVVGSGLPMPVPPSDRGVPGTGKIVELICGELRVSTDQYRTHVSPYQSAFRDLLGRRGLDAVNKVVREAVLAARDTPVAASERKNAVDNRNDACKRMEQDAGWHLPVGIASLGEMVASWPNRFARILLTSNFDPLLEVSLRNRNKNPVTISCDRDYSLEPLSAGDSPIVVHFHGFWSNGNTLHLPEQLLAPRPNLAESVRKLILRLGRSVHDGLSRRSW